MKIGDQVIFNTMNGLKIGRIIAKKYGKYVIKHKGKLYRRFFKELKMYNKMVLLAKKHNVEITENAVKIANFRERVGMSITVCPCAKGDPDRGCISEKCLHEIETTGCCHCGAFRRRDV